MTHGPRFDSASLDERTPNAADALIQPDKVDLSPLVSRTLPEEPYIVMEPTVPPPSPPAPIEPGPTMQDMDLSAEFLANETTDPSVTKEDLERAVLIECSEIQAQALSRNWEAVAALGQAMDLKVSAMSGRKMVTDSWVDSILSLSIR